MDYCICEEPCLILDPNHLFEICGKCGKIMKLTEFDLFLRDWMPKFIKTLKED